MTLDKNNKNSEELVSLLNALLDATPDLIFAKDINYKYLAHNKAFSNLVGRAGQDLTGLSDEDIFSNPEAINRLRETDIQVISHEKTLTNQETTVYPDGKTIKVDTLKVPFYSDEGQLMGLLGISRDVTRRVETEQQLGLAKEKAEAASRAKSEFLAKMSHEIRTPMNAVIGLSQLLSRTQLNYEQTDYVDKILNSAESLLNLINDILDYSKIEANRLTLEQVPFTLQSVLDKTITICELKALEKHLEFIIDVPSAAPKCLLGDPHRLQQVLINLANNAIKFTESGHVIVKIEFNQTDNNNADIKFSISDTGIGMSMEEQQQLFNAFCQADNSLTRQYEGSGLGLVICKQIVELMGGNIQVESKPGEGSTFSFNIKCPIVEQAECHRIQSINYPETKILVVDNSPVARRIIVEILTEFGCQVEAADSGIEAVNKVKAASDAFQDYDLIIMDWRMPGLDGISAAKQIKQDLGKSHIPAILLLSAYDLDEAKRIARPEQIDAYLEKPVIPQTLMESINKSLMCHSQPENTQTEKTSWIDPSSSKWDVGNLNFCNAKVLLVDDNNLNRKVTCGFLKDSNIQMDMAVDGEDAVEKVKKNDYDLVLMDIQMPKMDGYTATKLILQDPKTKDLPIIAMTAHAMESDRQECLAVGMKGHLIKPISISTLYEILIRFINVNRLNTNKPLKQPHQPEEPLISQLAELAELDINAAIQAYQFNQKLFVNLLEEFVSENKDIQHGIANAINELDEDMIFTKIHSLKTSTAYIGAYKMSHQCAYIESLIKQKQKYQKEVVKVANDVSQLVLSMQEIITLQQSNTQNTEQTGLSFRQYLLKLQPLLANSDFAAETLICDILTSTSDPTEHSVIKEISELVACVEFERASKICEVALARTDNG